MIFYFGGFFDDTLLPGYNPSLINDWHLFSYAMTFDTKTNIWGNHTLGGKDIPSIRISHTTTLCKNTNIDLIVVLTNNIQYPSAQWRVYYSFTVWGRMDRKFRYVTDVPVEKS
jgi:hypothetical protein